MPRKRMDIDKITIFTYKNEPGVFDYPCFDRMEDGMVLFTKGRGTVYFSDDEKYPIEKGDLVIFRAHDDYRIITDGPCSYIASYYTISQEHYVEYLQFPRVIKCDDKMHNQVIEISDIWQSRSWDSYIICKIKLMQVFLEIMQGIQRNAEFEDSDIRRAVEFIHMNFRRNFTMAELSEYCTISPSYLRTKFQKYVKSTITQYRDNLRISAAKELLKSNAYSVNSIAEEFGYFDVSHFSKAFLRHTGMTPAEYKARKRIK